MLRVRRFQCSTARQEQHLGEFVHEQIPEDQNTIDQGMDTV